MKKDSKKKNVLIQISTLIIISFIIITAHIKSEKNSWIESAAVTLFSPFQEGVTGVMRKMNRNIEKYFRLVDIEERLRKSEREKLEFIYENNILKEKLLMYERVDKFFSIKDSFIDQNLILSQVIGFNASGWSQMIVINKGTNDSILKNMAVITHEGLVGRIVASTKRYSKTMLITDVRSAVDAIIQRTRDRGIVAGVNEALCQMKYVSINSDVRKGDKVISSGIGGTVQKGFLIGTVSSVSEENHGLFREIWIKPASNLKKLEEVFIVRQSKKEHKEF